MIGIINIARQILNISMIMICFPIMVYYFLKNPQSFYTQFGIDPEIVKNLPTVKADATQIIQCAICTEDILEGNEILVLKCPGK
jgi:PP-loop superfamily ATP-utilizing enzyme